MSLEDWYFRISMFTLLYIATKIWNVIYTFWVAAAINKIDIKSFGKWALITGSTDGIGKEYARQLAARGCDIILVSRSLDKLKTVAAEIENEFKVKTKIVQIDFTGDLSIYDKLAKEIKGLEIGTLVNNVGVSYSYMEFFLDLPDWDKLVTDLIRVNIESMVRVTKIVLPDMVKRNKGIIINMGSASNDAPSPLLAVYGASKAFVAKFTENLRYEYGSKSIIIQCLSPNIISTNMSRVSSNYFFPSAKTYVTSTLGMLGLVSESSGYFIHSCMLYPFNILKDISEVVSIYIQRKIALIGRSESLKSVKQK